MNKRVMKIGQFDLNQIKYSEPRSLDSGARQMYVNYGPDNEQIVLHTPRFTLPFGMSVFDKGETPKYSFEASFRYMENYEYLREFYETFVKFDNKLVDDGVSMSLSWFKKRKANREVVEALYHSMIKPSRDRDTGEPDGKFPPTMRFKLPYRNGKFQFPVFDFDKNPIDLDVTPLSELLVKGAKVRTLIKCSGIWFASGRYGCTWNVVQLRVQPPADNFSRYAFLSDSDDNSNSDDDDDQDSVGNPTGGTAVDSDVSDGSDGDLNQSDNDSDTAQVVPIKITNKRKR